MSLKIAFNIDDADLEAGIAQARVAYNASADAPITSDEDYVAALSAAAMEAFRGSAKSAVEDKLRKVTDPVVIAQIGALADAAIAAQVVTVEPIEAVKP